MTYRLDPDRPLVDEVRRVALEGLDDATDRLRQTGGDAGDLEDDVHEARKRGKEARGLIRLVRPALGDAYAAINAEVRDGARELSSLRDAHALLDTVEDLASSLDGDGTDDVLEALAGHLRVAAAAATHGVDGDDPRLAVARSRMETARAMVASWNGSIDVDAMAGGVAKTAKRGRRAWKASREDASDEQVHEWRKRVKYLWYQARLLEPADPDGIGPLVAQLDDLSDLLGDEHDLTVLVEHLERAAGTEATAGVDVPALIELARARQATLRSEALELGAQVYGDGVDALVERLVGPWSGAGGSGEGVERERTFLVADMPELPDAGTRIRQGYLAIDGDVQVRIREREGDGRTLTVKGGRGAVRAEVELVIGVDRFEALWPLTAGRRIDKTRYVIPIGGADAELDVFAGDLTGLVLVEVELDSDEAMAAFEPPDWFGREVTDDDRYSNASLAVRERSIARRGARARLPR